MNIDNISYLILYFVLIKEEMLKTEFECEYKALRLLLVHSLKFTIVKMKGPNKQFNRKMKQKS